MNAASINETVAQFYEKEMLGKSDISSMVAVYGKKGFFSMEFNHFKDKWGQRMFLKLVDVLSADIDRYSYTVAMEIYGVIPDKPGIKITMATLYTETATDWHTIGFQTSRDETGKIIKMTRVVVDDSVIHPYAGLLLRTEKTCH